MPRIAEEGGGVTMPAQYRNVCQPSTMDDDIVYQPNPSMCAVYIYYVYINTHICMYKLL